MTIDYRFNAIERELGEPRKAVDAEVAKARDIAAALGARGFKEVKGYPYRHAYISVRETHPDAAQALADRVYQECVALRDGNEAAATHNQKLVGAVVEYGKLLGLPATKPVKVRRENKSVTADWISAILGTAPPAERWAGVEEWYRDIKRAIQERRDTLAREEQQREKRRKGEEKQRQRERVVGALGAKYGLGLDADGGQVLDRLLAGSKYLRLAHGMMRCRNDWADGPDPVRNGLAGFTVESMQAGPPFDTAIYEEINRILDNWCGDGRVFRDCAWNYDRLFALVGQQAPELLADYSALIEVGIGRGGD